MATLTSQLSNLNKRVVALENSELEDTDAVPFIVKLYAAFEVSPAFECGDGGYSRDKMELIINGAVKEVTNKIVKGDFSEGTNGYIPFNSTLSSNSNFLFNTGNGTSTSPYVTGPEIGELSINDKWFFYVKARVTGNGCSVLRTRMFNNNNTDHGILNPVQNQWYDLHGVRIFTSVTDKKIYFTHVYPDAATANGKVMEVEGWNGETAKAGIYAINLTQEFGAGNEPTAAQMKAAIDDYRDRFYPECSEDTELTAGAAAAIEELSTKINYSAVGTGTLPTPGSTGVVGEVARKPVGSVTTVESSETESVIVFSSYFDEQTANDELLTSAAVLYEATESAGTGKVVASETLNIEKTSAKTLTVSTEITITEVV
jgi:hypothetical protein